MAAAAGGDDGGERAFGNDRETEHVERLSGAACRGVVRRRSGEDKLDGMFRITCSCTGCCRSR